MNYKITRDSSYQADERSKEEDIQHWKYIKKKKVNGKWRYYYKDDTDTGLYEKIEGKPNDTYGTYKRVGSDREEIVVRKKSDKLLSDSYTLQFDRYKKEPYGPRYAVRRYESVGLIEQYANKTVKSISKGIDKAKKWLSNLFRR